MTRNRRVRVILIIMSLAFLVGCNNKCNHPPRQSLENIKAVELIEITSRSFLDYEDVCNAKVLRTVDPESWTMLINEIEELPCTRHVMDPSVSYHGSVLRIQYEDGSMELMSRCGLAVWDGSDWSCESHVVDEEVFTNFCDRIVGE